jgi:hypothetical protein
MLPRQCSQSTQTSTAQPANRFAVWILLAGWLIYSAAALGWNLAHDPLLSIYICRAR